ncbi:RNA polymerase sigma factor [Azospirillum sp. TSO5]|uniref:RNA polymerase sigma factor n=1 Tax=Azospirillum sp. TSO5 TaxID=716760 RepID=UPI000D64DFF3|nr:RNA polymerase sigma factor [Azospirillum sp. TSO5]
MSGPPDDFGTQLGAMLPAMRRRARNLTKDRTRAEELVGDTALRAWSSRERFDGQNLGGWLNRIMVNLHINDRRRRKLVQEIATEDAAFDKLMAPVARQDVAVELRQTLSFIDQIPEPWRGLFIAAKIDGVTYQELAQAEGLPMGTIQSRIHRATARLERAMGGRE